MPAYEARQPHSATNLPIRTTKSTISVLGHCHLVAEPPKPVVWTHDIGPNVVYHRGDNQREQVEAASRTTDRTCPTPGDAQLADHGTVPNVWMPLRGLSPPAASGIEAAVFKTGAQRWPVDLSCAL